MDDYTNGILNNRFRDLPSYLQGCDEQFVNSHLNRETHLLAPNLVRPADICIAPPPIQAHTMPEISVSHYVPSTYSTMPTSTDLGPGYGPYDAAGCTPWHRCPY